MGTKGGLNLHQLKGNKKLHSPTGDPGLENGRGVDFGTLKPLVTTQARFVTKQQNLLNTSKFYQV